jgi:hypothetical protein
MQQTNRTVGRTEAYAGIGPSSECLLVHAAACVLFVIDTRLEAQGVVQRLSLVLLAPLELAIRLFGSRHSSGWLSS